jgi:nitrogen fixation-related uncharacterized protein
MPRLTPFQAAVLRKQAVAQAQAAATSGTATGSAYELLQAQLFQHTRDLKNIQSVERKIGFKAEVLPLYFPWIEGVLQADGGGEDMVFTTVFVWCIDVGQFDQAIAMADHILRHGLALPDRYQRSAAVTLMDEFADASLRPSTQGTDAAPSLAHLIAVRDLTDAHDAPDQARAKLYKAIGYAVAQRKTANDNYETLDAITVDAALAALTRAAELHKDSGVKKDIERLERRKDALKKAAQT